MILNDSSDADSRPEEGMDQGYGKGTTCAPADRVWDVAIVGAGPAGATAALVLAARGRDVVLIDRSSFPRDKVCGDALIADSIRALRRTGLYDEVRARAYRTERGSVFSPSRVEFDVPGEYLTLKRIHLDGLIVNKALSSGARFQNYRVAEVEVQPDGGVHLAGSASQPPIRARIALIATGANVELAGKLGLVEQPGPSAVALRCYVKSRAVVDRLIISYDRSMTPGYAWIFPLGKGEYNVGAGVRYMDGIGPEVSLRESFARFSDEFPIAAELFSRAEDVTPLRGAQLRCGLSGTARKGPGNVLVIGETMGTTFPFTGEGIGKAMETGEVAARMAHAALSAGDFSILDGFPAQIENELRRKFVGYLFAERWLSRPWLNDLAARRIRSSAYLQKAVAGIINETVDPREVFSFRGVLRSFLG